MRYLLDELQTYEEDYSDVLAPVHRGQCESLVGEAASLSYLTAEESRARLDLVSARLDAVQTQLSQLTLSLNNHLPPNPPSMTLHILICKPSFVLNMLGRTVTE